MHEKNSIQGPEALKNEKKFRIGITYDLKAEHTLKPGEPKDRYAEFDDEGTIDMIEAAIRSGGHDTVRIGNGKRLASLLSTNTMPKVDIIFNICEGLNGRSRESQVPAILDMYDIPFVGSDALAMGVTLDKAITKKMLVHAGIKTPEFMVARCAEDIDVLTEQDLRKRGLSFPLIVKLMYEGTSKGLTQDCVVKDLNKLRSKVKELTEGYSQPVIIERLISGTEFTVPIIGNMGQGEGPEALEVVQIAIGGRTDLGDDIYTNEIVESPNVRYICPANIEPAMADKIKEAALATYIAVESRDFGRVDLRMDQSGVPYVLEINPLPSLSKHDVWPLVAKIRGTTYDALINRIIDNALERYGMI
jgi:D-alanine-D-alanine ligase